MNHIIYSKKTSSIDQKFNIDDSTATVNLTNLTLNSNSTGNFNEIYAGNILNNYTSEPSGYLTGINYSGNYNAGYFVGKINILDGVKQVVNPRIGEKFTPSNLSNPTNPLFKQVAGSTDGRYLTAVAGNVFGNTTGNMFNSNDYGKNWNINQNLSPKTWFGIAASADGKYQSAVVFSGNIYLSKDYGNNWQEKIINDVDGYSRFSSIAVSANGRYQTAVVYYDRIDIENEPLFGLYTSNNYGESWISQGGLYPIVGKVGRTQLLFKSCAMNGDGQYQLAVSYGFPPDTGFFYTSNDYGNTWTERYLPLSVCNQRFMAAGMSNLGKIQLLCTQSVPSELSKKSIFISYDYGNSWNTGVGPTGLPIDGIGGMNDDGSVIGVCGYNNKLYISTNYGADWQEKSDTKNWTSLFLSSNAKYLVGTVYGDPSGIYISKTPEFTDGDFYADNFYANNIIYNTGNQTLDGIKTFASGIISPNLVYNTGNQNISGIKTFANNINVSGIGIFNNIIVPNLASNYPPSQNIRRYVPDSTVTFGTAISPSGIINYFPFVLKKDAINPNLCIESTSAVGASDTSIKIGIYSGAGFEGGNLFYSGTLDVLTSEVPSIQRLKTNITLSKGAYILASCNTGTASPITFRNIAANGFLSYFGVATGSSTFLDGGSPTLSDFVIYESGSDLKSKIGTGIWSRTRKSPVVCLEY